MDIGKEVKEVEFQPLETDEPAPIEPAAPDREPVVVPEEAPAGV